MPLIDTQWDACCLPHDSGRCGNLLPALLMKEANVFIGHMTDVVKTRLQVEARKGQTSYKGLADAFTKICKFILVELR